MQTWWLATCKTCLQSRHLQQGQVCWNLLTLFQVFLEDIIKISVWPSRTFQMRNFKISEPLPYTKVIFNSMVLLIPLLWWFQTWMDLRLARKTKSWKTRIIMWNQPRSYINSRISCFGFIIFIFEYNVTFDTCLFRILAPLVEF